MFSIIATLFISGALPQALAHLPSTPTVSLTNPTSSSIDYSFTGTTPLTNAVNQHSLQVMYCLGTGCDPFGIDGIPIGPSNYSYCTGHPCNPVTPTDSGTIISLACETDVTLGARERHAGGAFVYAVPSTLTTLPCDYNGDDDPVQTFNPGTINRKTLQKAQDWTANTRVTNYGSVVPNYLDVSVDIECGSGAINFGALSVHLDGTTLVTKLNRNAIISSFPTTGDLSCTADTTVGGSGPAIPLPDPDPAPFRIITR